MATFFTSDTHLGHASIIGYCNRPFASAAEMDGAIIANWNAVVRPDDDVWHLGDFAHRDLKPAASYLARLSGRKHLIWGNHDSAQTRGLPGWSSSRAMAEIAVEGTRIVLLHYAMKVWPRSHRGVLHFYGHSHGSLPGDGQSLDVGVDCWDFRPVTLAEIRRRLATLPDHRPPDRHGA